MERAALCGGKSAAIRQPEADSRKINGRGEDMGTKLRRLWKSSLFGGLGLLLTAVGPALADDGHGLTITTLSGAPDRVSGGSALVEITFRGNDHLTIRLNGRDVSGEFQPGSTPHSLVGLVTGLTLGRNTLTVEGRHERSSLRLTNYSIK